MTLHSGDWIDSYLEYCQNSESPEQFHRWTALSVIAGVLQRRVWINYGYFKIYPNMYVVLVAPPGKARKTSAMSIGSSFLKNVKGVTLCSEATTVQQLTVDMAASFKMFPVTELKKPTTGGAAFVAHSSMTAFSEELGSLLQTADTPMLLTRLTNFYDSPDTWTSKTKTQGSETITGLCFNLLGATTPEWIQEFLPSNAVGGGFTSRVIFVWAQSVDKLVPRPFVTEEMKVLKIKLLKDLESFSQLHGEVHETPAAHAFFNDWYMKNAEKIPPILDKRFWGYFSRKHLHLMKIALAIAVGRTGKLVIDDVHMKEALELLNKAEPGFIPAFGGMGRSTLTPLVMDIRNYIAEHGTVTEEQLFSANWRDTNIEDFDKAIGILDKLKEVKVVRNGNVTTFSLKEKK